MQYDNLKLETLIKVSPFPPKVYENSCLVKNIKPIHLKGKNEFRMPAPIFYYPTQFGDQNDLVTTLNGDRKDSSTLKILQLNSFVVIGLTTKKF
jgi:hypothetical protein